MKTTLEIEYDQDEVLAVVLTDASKRYPCPAGYEYKARDYYGSVKVQAYKIEAPEADAVPITQADHATEPASEEAPGEDVAAATEVGS
jgi:hypothetical protein